MKIKRKEYNRLRSRLSDLERMASSQYVITIPSGQKLVDCTLEMLWLRLTSKYRSVASFQEECWMHGPVQIRIIEPDPIGTVEYWTGVSEWRPSGYEQAIALGVPPVMTPRSTAQTSDTDAPDATGTE